MSNTPAIVEQATAEAFQIVCGTHGTGAPVSEQHAKDALSALCQLRGIGGKGRREGGREGGREGDDDECESG